MQKPPCICGKGWYNGLAKQTEYLPVINGVTFYLVKTWSSLILASLIAGIGLLGGMETGVFRRMASGCALF